jgi:ABC-2 type transport system permease protein
MLSFSSVWAIVIRHIRLWKNDFNYVLGGFYWPLLDILVWGFLGAWISRASIAQFQHYETAALLGILLWQVVGRGCNVMVVTFCEELWQQNIVNLFSLPLRITEWMLGAILFAAVMIVCTACVSITAIYLLYDVSLFHIITTFLICMLPLFFCAIWLGFTCLQIVVTFGKRGVELGFVLGWFFLPFSGAYYPIDVLPSWAQAFSKIIPMSYIFTGMREYVMKQKDPTMYLIKGTVLSIIYAMFALLFFVYCFNRAKRKGLARLAD